MDVRLGSILTLADPYRSGADIPVCSVDRRRGIPTLLKQDERHDGQGLQGAAAGYVAFGGGA